MSSSIKIAEVWEILLGDELEKPYFKDLSDKVNKEYLSKIVFPPQPLIFRALELCPPKQVRLVILGQDPYHTPGVADGLAFSSPADNPIPPSLRNIFKEIEREYGKDCGVLLEMDEIRDVGKAPKKAYSDTMTESPGPHNEEVRHLHKNRSPDISGWAEQGVLLLNTSLTVEAGQANSHASFGWHEFTDAVICRLSEKEEHIVFLLWGNYARQKAALIDGSKHLILESAHPSPLSAYKGFLGNGHFKTANEYLATNGRGSINWCD